MAAAINEKTIKMKKIFLLLTLALASCNANMTEKVEATYSNGKPRVVRCYDKHAQCMKEIEYYETGQVKMEGGMKTARWKGSGRPISRMVVCRATDFSRTASARELPRFISTMAT